MGHRNTLYAFLWIGGVAVAAHLLYSRLGFNPTDDGFTLAYSRRLLDGQIPHRDFISIRPCLSPALHMPEVLLGGSYTYWLSRFVFFLQWACIAWFSTAFIVRGLDLTLKLREQAALAIVSFVFCCHSFPPMAWHTVDGLFLSVIGLYLRSRPGGRKAWLAYFLLGSAYLCKQSFVFVAPATLLLYGDWKHGKRVAAVALPGVLYVALLVFTNALSDGLEQLLSQGDIARYGVDPYLNNRFLVGLVAGIATSGLLYGASPEDRPRLGALRRALGGALVAMAFLLAARGLARNGLLSVPLGLVGMVSGAVLHMALKSPRGQFRQVRTGAALVVLAWSVSLSIGYNTPALASGILLTFMLGLLYRGLAAAGARWRPLVSLVVAVVSITTFHYARTHHVYRDRPASELTASLGDVLPGGKLIRTNPNTHAFLADLNSAIETVAAMDLDYAIVPDLAGYWAKSTETNPLPIDWPQGIELNTPALFDRVTRSIEKQRPSQAVILQKVGAEDLALGFFELKTVEGEWFHTVVIYVRSHLDLVGETQYFDIYR